MSESAWTKRCFIYKMLPACKDSVILLLLTVAILMTTYDHGQLDVLFEAVQSKTSAMCKDESLLGLKACLWKGICYDRGGHP